MLRHVALLTMTAALACTNGRSTDPPAASGSFAPHLSRLGDRTVLSWVERDPAGLPSLRFALRSRDGWAGPGTAPHDPLLAPDALDVPAVVPLGDGGLAAYWTVARDGSKDARDLVVALSTDGGLSWSKPARPHRDDSETEHGMATLLPADGGGDFGICWLDGRAGALSEYGEGATALYWSDWSGGAFGPEVLLDARVCDCCKTSVAQGPAGPVVAYRDRDADDTRDISIVRRDAASWSAPQPVHGDGWTLSACPTNGPAIAIRGASTAVAWFTGANTTPSVWTSISPDGGTTLSPPVRIDSGAPIGRVEATMLTDGSAAVVWLERKGANAEVRARRLAPDGTLTPPVVVGTTSSSRASGFPAIAASDARDVLVAWTATGAAGRVRASVVTLP